jgi:predicted phosphoribosyltransferase
MMESGSMSTVDECRVQKEASMFADRREAGRRLADRLRAFPRGGLVVLGLPRGGVPVAFEVARELGAPLDIIVVRKLGVPFRRELAMGAIGEGGVRIVDNRVVTLTGVTASDINKAQAREEAELARRAERFRGTRERVPLTGRTALIVDDGIATGSTVRAACKVARAHGATRVVVATPVAAPETVASLRNDADDVIALSEPDDFSAIGQFYEDFTQTPDEEVVRLLATSVEPGRDDDVEARR